MAVPGGLSRRAAGQPRLACSPRAPRRRDGLALDRRGRDAPAGADRRRRPGVLRDRRQRRAGSDAARLARSVLPRAAGTEPVPAGCPGLRPGTRPRCLQVLAGVADRVDRAARLGPLVRGDERPDEDDPLALLAGDLRPVVGVGGVRQVLVLGELVEAGLEQVTDPQPPDAGIKQVLDRHLLRAVDDVLDHRARVEVLEVQDLLVAAGIGDLEELVLLRLLIHPGDRPVDHPRHRRPRVTAELRQVLRVQRQVGVRYLLKISRAASTSGRSILIFTSSRPGRRIAGSIMSSRFEAPMMITLSSPSTPSISLSSCGTMVFSTSEDTPVPRVRNRESISSKKTITGIPSEALSRAR